MAKNTINYRNTSNLLPPKTRFKKTPLSFLDIKEQGAVLRFEMNEMMTCYVIFALCRVILQIL